VEIVESCPECRRLSGQYETATIEWFRVQGQLQIAEYSRAEGLSDRIVSELTVIAKRRQMLREKIESHMQEMHPRTVTASNS